MNNTFRKVIDCFWRKHSGDSPCQTSFVVFQKCTQNSLTLYILKLICISSILFSIYFQWIWQGEFVKQSKVLKLMIISFILVTFLFYSGVILWGEIRCKSILEFKGLTAKGFVDELDGRSLSIWIYTKSEKKDVIG